MPVTSQSFGSFAKGDVTLYSLTSDVGVRADVMNYGAALVSLCTPDRNGNLSNIVLGYDRLEDYLTDKNYIGVIVGRYANRIANGSFMLDSRNFDLPNNDGENHLHGGVDGFDKRLWQAMVRQDANGCGVKFTLDSPHLDQGYPGNLTVGIEYWLTHDGMLSIFLTAETDRVTVVNLASHSYFNLSYNERIDGHRIRLFASSYTPVDKDLIPTGVISPVAGSPFDFRAEKEVGIDLTGSHPQLVLAGGFDHNFVVDGPPGTLRPVADVSDPGSGRQILISSTQPGVQFYTGNMLAGKFKPHAGLCLETQHFPDSPNRSSFPSTLVFPEEPYAETIEYRFSVTSEEVNVGV